MPYDDSQDPRLYPGLYRRYSYSSRVPRPKPTPFNERSRIGTYVPRRTLSLAEVQRASPNLSPDWWARRYAAGLRVQVNPLMQGGAVTSGNRVYLSPAAFADTAGIQGTLTHEGQHVRQQALETPLRLFFGMMAPQARRSPQWGAKFGNEILPTLAGGGYPEFSQAVGLGAGNYQTPGKTPPLLRPLFAGYFK